jgi:hypothetical protein
VIKDGIAFNTECRNDSYHFTIMTVLGPLKDEPPEPMTKDELERVRKRLRESWNGSVTLEKKTVEQLLNEITWLKRRLHRVATSSSNYRVEPPRQYAQSS